MKSSSTELKERDKMSHRLLKRLKIRIGSFFRIFYRMAPFLKISMKGIFKILKKSFVSILQSGYIFKKKIKNQKCHSSYAESQSFKQFEWLDVPENDVDFAQFIVEVSVIFNIYGWFRRDSCILEEPTVHLYMDYFNKTLLF